MKKFLIVATIVIWSFVGYQVTAYAEPTKKPVPTKKMAKKHQKFDGKKIADDKPTKPKAPVKNKK